MTYDEVLRLPGNTRVLLKDGKVGHIVSWYHTAQAVAVEVGPERRIISAKDFRLALTGSWWRVRRTLPPIRGGQRPARRRYRARATAAGPAALGRG